MRHFDLQFAHGWPVRAAPAPGLVDPHRACTKSLHAECVRVRGLDTGAVLQRQSRQSGRASTVTPTQVHCAQHKEVHSASASASARKLAPTVHNKERHCTSALGFIKKMLNKISGLIAMPIIDGNDRLVIMKIFKTLKWFIIQMTHLIKH